MEIRVYAHPPPTLCVRKCKFAPKLLNLFDPILILTHREYPASLLSEQLYCVQYYFVIKPTRCTNFTNLFWHETLHVSESSSVHHQEFIHGTLSNGIRHTGL